MTVNGDLIIEAAAFLWRKMPEYEGLPEPKWWQGWLAKFKKRHNSKQRRLYRESASVDVEKAAGRLLEIQEIVKEYDSKDIYNCDETGLFWRMIPHKTLFRYQHEGSKVDKARITAHLTCNADGSHKLDPWLIGNSKNPRAFGRQNQKKIKAMPFIYRFNKKAWMTGEIFRQYLEWFDNQMVGRQVLFLCDRFSAHEAAIHAATDREELRLRYTRVEFLPTNATSLYQPLDQGIINNVKVHYRKYWLTFMLHLTMSDRDPSKEATLFNAVWWLNDA